MPEMTAFVRELLEGPNFWLLGTVNPDGQSQINPMWVDIEGDDIILNTAIGRRKEKNLRNDPRLTLAITDKDNPYEYVEIRGEIIEYIEGDDAEAGIDKLAKKYIGEDVYPWRTEGERRLKMRIKPTFIHHLTR